MVLLLEVCSKPINAYIKTIITDRGSSPMSYDLMNI